MAELGWRLWLAQRRLGKWRLEMAGITAAGTIGITAGTTGTISGITGNFRGCAGPRHADILRCGAADPHRRAAADAVLQYQLSLLLSASAGCKNCPAFADGGCDIRKNLRVGLVEPLSHSHLACG